MNSYTLALVVPAAIWILVGVIYITLAPIWLIIPTVDSRAQTRSATRWGVVCICVGVISLIAVAVANSSALQ